MRYGAILLLALVGLSFSGCQSWFPRPWAVFKVWHAPVAEPTITVDEYMSRQRELSERYMYGTPEQALKAGRELLSLELDYAKDGEGDLNSNQAIMVAYTRLYVLSDALHQNPEAEMYYKGALKYAKLWQPGVNRLTSRNQEAFVRGYLEEFEKGLEINWKNELK